MIDDEKITQWFINSINGTPSEEQLALRKVYELNEEVERLNKENEHLRTALNTKENIIKEAIEYIENKVISSGEVIDQLRKIEVKELLEMLDKVEEE